jgi:hypothetical protein
MVHRDNRFLFGEMEALRNSEKNDEGTGRINRCIVID